MRYGSTTAARAGDRALEYGPLYDLERDVAQADSTAKLNSVNEDQGRWQML